MEGTSTLVLHQSSLGVFTATAIPGGLTIGDGNGGPLSDIVVMEGSGQVAGDVTVNASGFWELGDFFNVMTGTLTINAGSVHIGSGLLTLGGDVIVPDGSVGGLIDGPLSLGTATRTFTIGLGDSSDLEIEGAISGGESAGLVKTGGGTLRLINFPGADSSYQGTTVVKSGALIMESATVLGSTAAGTVVEPTGTLVVHTDTPILEPLVLHSDAGVPAIVCDKNGVQTWSSAASGVQVTLESAANRLVTQPSCTLQMGLFSGPGGVIIEDHGNGFELAGPVAHAGPTIVASGVLRVTGNQFLSPASDVVLQSTTLDLHLAGPSAVQHIKSLQGTGQVVMGSSSFDVLMPENVGATFAGVISGTGQVHKHGIGHWTLTGANTYTGDTAIFGGTLTIDGSVTGLMFVQDSHAPAAGVATVDGTGTVGSIFGVDGHLQAGHADTPGRLTTGSVELDATDVTFGAIINGATAGSGYSQLVVHGTVKLGGAKLALSGSTLLPVGTGDLILIDNDGTDPIVGTFAGLAEGAEVAGPNGATFRISYVGGTGNDVTLTPRGSEYLLSEGSTGPFFDTDLLIANPNPVTVPITIKFLREDGTAVTLDRTLPATSRTTIRVDDIAGMETTAFSTIVTSHTGLPLVVERTMTWDASAYGGHTERAVPGAALTWYFAEGSQGFFSTFLLLVNPQSTMNTATVQYLIEGEAAIVRTYPLPAASRVTVDLGADPALRARAFGMIVTFGAPGVAERAMYFGTNPLWKGGHESAGVHAPANTWYVAEGATGAYFTTFILLANPTATDAQATLTFMPQGGSPVTTTHRVPAHGRVTVNIAGEDPSFAQAAAVATTVTSSGAPILVERAQYWPFTPDQWQEAHNSFGVSELSPRWGLAEGRVGGPRAYQTYILLANPNEAPANVTIHFLREDGTTITKSFVVAPTSRLNVSVGPGTAVPELIDERFGAVLIADQPIAVERSMYWNANGIVWAAGTSATGTPLP